MKKDEWMINVYLDEVIELMDRQMIDKTRDGRWQMSDVYIK